MIYLGDYSRGATLCRFFNTRKSDGTPYSLATSASTDIYVYKVDTTSTEVNTGVTLVKDIDGLTGCNSVKIDLSDVFYAVGYDYNVILKVGTINGVSSVGTVLCTFSIENRNIKADLISILGSAITGTAANIVGAFTKFFNIASPTGTINSLPDAIPGAENGLPVLNASLEVPKVKTITDDVNISSASLSDIGDLMPAPVEGDSNVSAESIADITSAIFNAPLVAYTTPGTFGNVMDEILVNGVVLSSASLSDIIDGIMLAEPQGYTNSGDSLGALIYELQQRFGGKVTIDRGTNDITVYKTDGVTVLYTLSLHTDGLIDTITR